jgi:aminoglycoside phosphotransferase (APT) family kinase protein
MPAESSAESTARPDELPSDIRREMTTTATDLDDLRARLQAWLCARTGGPAQVGVISRPPEAGMSNVSLLFDASWTADGDHHQAGLVARMAPDAAAVPVFPDYDLQRQFDVISAVARRSSVPVPRLRWIEHDPSVLGSPFFVMDRVDGRVPVDNPPYVFLGWFFDAPPEQRRELQDATVRLLAELHAIPDPMSAFPSLAADVSGDPLRSHVDAQRRYYEWTRRADRMRIPVIEDAFDWMDDHWPAHPGETVLSWGDSRIGNVIYDGFTPVAVLDWEMAGLGPREIDVAWFIFIHRFFQDIATMFEQPGLPDVCRREDVVTVYEEASGAEIHDLDFYLVYAALRHAIVMSQVKRRMIHFGEDTEPATLDEYVMFHATMRAYLDGTYDWTTK